MQNQSGLGTKVPGSSGCKTCAKNGEPRNKIRPCCAGIKPVNSAAKSPYALQSCYEGSPSRPRGAIVGGRRFAMTEPNKLTHHGVPDHQPAAGGIAARARAAATPQY